MFRFYSNAGSGRVSVVAEHSEGMLKIAVARCSHKDNFIRRKGRAIAEGRLEKGKLYSSIPMKECDIQTFIHHAKMVAEEVQQTKRVYKVTEQEVAFKRLKSIFALFNR
jgi:hypothetical protein